GIHDPTTSDPTEMEWLTLPPAASLQASENLLDRLHARGADAERLATMPLHPRLGRLMLDAERADIGDTACRVAALLSSGQRVRSTDLFTALDEERDPRTRAVYEQLRRHVRPGKTKHDDEALAKTVLAAFPDRVGRQRANGVVLLSNGTSATLSGRDEFFVAIDAEGKPSPIIRLACRIEPEWLIDGLIERS